MKLSPAVTEIFQARTMNFFGSAMPVLSAAMAAGGFIAGQAQGAVVGALTGLFVSAVSTACFQLGLYEGAAVQAEAGSTQAHGEPGTHQQDLFEA
jgi:hypothetical protein